MAQLKDFKYYLRKKISAGVYEYYFLSAGAVASQVSPIEISHAPKGWMEKSIRWARNLSLWGIFTSYTAPMQFVTEASKILRDIFYKGGIEGNCEFYIERLNRTDRSYELYFRGEIDFSTTSDEQNFFTANIKQGEYLDKLTAREDTNYEVPLDTNPDFFYVNMDGITLISTLKYITIDEKSSPFPTFYHDVKFDWAYQHYIQSIPGSDSSGLVGIQFNQEHDLSHLVGATIANPAGVWDPNNFFFYANNESWMTITFAYNVAIRNHGPGIPTQPDIKLNVYVVILNEFGKQSSGTLVYTSPLWIPDGAGVSIQPLFFTTVPLNILKGQKLAIQMIVTTSPNLIDHTGLKYDIAVEQGYLTLDFETKLPQTYIKAIRPKKVFDELVDKISDGEVTATSTFLETEAVDYVVTSGDGLRGLPDAVIKTSFKDFYTSYDNIFNLGTFYDKIAEEHVINTKADVLDYTTTIATIGDVNSMKITEFKEQLFSKLLIGYKANTYDGVNGKDEFNTQSEFLSPITRLDNSKDMLSMYRADMYGIEFARANLEGKTTTDASSDNDVFILNIEDTPAGTHLGVDYYNLYREPGLVISNLYYADDAFNINLSPKRNLLRNGSYIRALLHLLDAKYIKFQTSDKNSRLSTDDGVTVIAEDADVLISDLDSPLFYPITFEFDCVLPINISALLESNPYGCIEFTYLGNTYKGFLLSAQEDPAFRQKQTLKLLSTPDNDLTNLIH